MRVHSQQRSTRGLWRIQIRRRVRREGGLGVGPGAAVGGCEVVDSSASEDSPKSRPMVRVLAVGEPLQKGLVGFCSLLLCVSLPVSTSVSVSLSTRNRLS